MNGLETKGGIKLLDIKIGDVQYLWSREKNAAYYLRYRVHRLPKLNERGEWEWWCKSSTNKRAYTNFRIHPDHPERTKVIVTGKRK